MSVLLISVIIRSDNTVCDMIGNIHHQAAAFNVELLRALAISFSMSPETPNICDIQASLHCIHAHAFSLHSLELHSLERITYSGT